MKLMDIDIDTLGIPETDYDATVVMQSAEFARIVRDLSALGESVKIEVTKEGIRFSADGEAANGSVLLKATESARERYKDIDDDEEGSSKVKVKKEKTDKPRKRKRTDADVKMEDGEAEVEEDDGGEKEGLFKPASDDEAEKEDEEEGESEVEEESDSATKKRKRAAVSKKKSKADDGSDSTGGVMVELSQGVNLTFSLKYLVNFAKSTALSNYVTLKMSNEVPLLVGVSTYKRLSPIDLSCNRSTTSSDRVTSSTTLRLKSETSKRFLVFHVCFLLELSLVDPPRCIINTVFSHLLRDFA